MRIRKFAKTGHGSFYCLLALLLLLILVRYALQVDIPRVVLLIVIGIMALLGNRDEIVASCVCFIPMHESIDLYYALVICTVIYAFKNFRRFRFGNIVPLVFVIVIWELLHCFQSSFSPINLLTSVIPFVLLAVIMSSDDKCFDYPFIVRAFSWATFGVTLILFIRVLFFFDFDIMTALTGLQRLGSDYHSNIQKVAVSGGQINPNSLGVITVLASTGLMQLRHMKVSKVSDMILMCLMIVFASLSTSRTYLVCLAIMFILLVFSEKGRMGKKIQLIAVLSLILAVVVLAFATLFPETFEYFISRFSVDDITTGRGSLMATYSRLILSSPVVMLFGLGLQDYANKLLQISNVVPHSSIQEVILAWGVPGLILFGILIFNMYTLSSRHNKNQSLINWIPLIIILVKSLAGQLLTSSYTMLALLFAYLSLCHDLSPIEEGHL